MAAAIGVVSAIEQKELADEPGCDVPRALCPGCDLRRVLEHFVVGKGPRVRVAQRVRLLCLWYYIGKGDTRSLDLLMAICTDSLDLGYSCTSPCRAPLARGRSPGQQRQDSKPAADGF